MEDKTMVNDEVFDNDDELDMPDDIIEDDEDSDEEDVEEFIDDESEDEPKEQPKEQPKQTPEGSTGDREPGYVQRRIQQALARERESIRAEMEATYAPLRERLLEMDAKELVRSGEFKTIERAKEYLQLKQGVTPQPVPQSNNEQQTRNAQGQFAPKHTDERQARAHDLAVEANTIKAFTGLDVMAEFDRDPEIKQKILSGEMTFTDVAKQMKAGKPKSKRPPALTRSPNGASGERVSVLNMSDEAFDRMEAQIDEGKRFTQKM